jgi:hypothetical protein
MDGLRGLGLGRYERDFRDADADVTILSDLTDQDLEKLGVTLGHRKRRLTGQVRRPRQFHRAGRGIDCREQQAGRGQAPDRPQQTTFSRSSTALPTTSLPKALTDADLPSLRSNWNDRGE